MIRIIILTIILFFSVPLSLLAESDNSSSEAGLFYSCMDKNFYEASLINDKLMPLHRALFLESSPGPVKYAASKLDLCSEEVRLPVTKINNDTKKIIDNALRHASLIK